LPYTRPRKEYTMARRPKKACAHPGCPELIEPGQTYCIKHRRQEYKRYDEQRGTAAQRGYGSRWARYARLFKRANPLCRACLLGGRVTPVYVVDHITPVTGPDDPLFWEPGNHQSLCETCHNIKRATEDKETWSRRRGDG
jgi:5-methylcytosine-specific restriction protein A